MSITTSAVGAVPSTSMHSTVCSGDAGVLVHVEVAAAVDIPVKARLTVDVRIREVVVGDREHRAAIGSAA